MPKMRAAVVYSCCSVACWGYTTELCWACGQHTGRDAWKNSISYNYDDIATRRIIDLRDKQPKKSPI